MDLKCEFINILRNVYIAYVGVANHIITHAPLWCIRRFFYRYVYFMKIGKGAYIHMGVKFKKPRWITLGENTIINSGCILDGRKGLTMGSNVDIGEQVAFYCGAHDVQSPGYTGIMTPTVIGDRVCIYARAMIIRGMTIGEGAVIGAGSIVTRDVPPYAIVAGNPARKLGERNRNLTYVLNQRYVRQTWQETAKQYGHDKQTQ